MMQNRRDEVSIFWFRRDLRLDDNHALFQALKSGHKVLCIFIFDKDILSKLTSPDDARLTFIHQTVSQLNESLRSYNSTLLTFYDTPIAVFEQLTKEYKIQSVYINRDYEPYGINRDSAVERYLKGLKISFLSFKDHVIFEKSDIVKKDHSPYTIFTPYKNQWLDKITKSDLDEYNTKTLLKNTKTIDYKEVIKIEILGFKNSSINIPALELNHNIIDNYNDTRDIPSLPTSKLGVHLRFGTISIRKCIAYAQKNNTKWLNELIWREFFMMILFHFPKTVDHSFKPAYDFIPWRNNEDDFKRWCSGTTGYPLVDAGMRELNATGFMHNRVRMVVASFLCKNLLIDWRWGERYFAEKLLDFELSANVGNWQWAAGSGCDAAPYFRVFNPVIQLEKFDKNQIYVKKWIPELEMFDYPRPIVEQKSSAARAISVYKKALEEHRK